MTNNAFSVLSHEETTFGKRTGTVYRLNTEQNGRIAITHLPAAARDREQAPQPLLFQPGMFSNRRFWLSDKGIGLAEHLSQQGYDCWIMERRGLGASGKHNYKNNHLMQAFEYDIPAALAFIQQHNTLPVFLIGHSFGGVVNSLSLAHQHITAERVAGLVNFSSQLTVGKRFLNKPYSLIIYLSTALLGHFPARKLKMGPENESPQTMRDCCRLVSWAKGRKRKSFWNGFNTIQCPILAFGSDGDIIDPAEGCRELIEPMDSEDKTFIQLGTAQGHKKDYDHVGMLVSKEAQQEVWPMLDEWLAERRQDMV